VNKKNDAKRSMWVKHVRCWDEPYLHETLVG
jgi:hypothetical protein